MQKEVQDASSSLRPLRYLKSAASRSRRQAGIWMCTRTSCASGWKEFSSDPQQAFPGHGQMKPEQQEDCTGCARNREAEAEHGRRAYSCGLHRVERLMRENGLRARPRRRRLPKDTGERSAVSDNLLDRAFEASAPNQKWIADFTYIWTAEGWLYVAAVVDLFSRRVVGWAMKAEMTAQLVTDALIMAIWRRGKPTACCTTPTRDRNIRASSSSD